MREMHVDLCFEFKEFAPIDKKAELANGLTRTTIELVAALKDSLVLKRVTPTLTYGEKRDHFRDLCLEALVACEHCPRKDGVCGESCAIKNIRKEFYYVKDKK